ncbi:TonB-dependent receptor [Marinilabiliaceae bacterium JC017]|nr:TonB-dependent receptor [Marinilabiliaceae bacterium JC017]
MIKKTILALGILCVSPLLLKSQSLSDTINIKEVEVTANILLKKEEAGVTKTTVDTIAMMESQHLSLSELISTHTPIFIKHYGRGSLATASFRGTAPSHTQVQWNGISLNSPMLGMVDFSLIPVWFFDDAQLYHGGGSLHLSSGALGGTIALKGKPMNWNQSFSATALAGLASFHTYDYFTALGFGSKKWQSKTKAFYSSSENDFEYTNKLIRDLDSQTGEETHPTEKNDAPYENYGLLQEFYWRPATDQIIALRGWGQQTIRTIPLLLTDESDRTNQYSSGGFYTTEKFVTKKKNEQINKALRLSAQWKKYGELSQWCLQTGLNHENNDYIAQHTVSGDTTETTLNANSLSSSWYNSLNWKLKLGKTTVLHSGLDYQHHNVHSNDTVSKTGYDKIQSLLSAHAKIAGQITDAATWSLLLREECIDGNWQPFLPYLGLEWQPLKNSNLVIKASAAKNAHYPTLNDLYYLPGGNPDLKIEESITVDGGPAFSWKKNKLHFNCSITGFYSDVKNWIIWLPTYKGYWEPINIEKVVSKGFESNLLAQLKYPEGSITLNLSYAMTHALNYGNPINWADDSYGKQLPYIPVHSGTTGTTICYKNWELNHTFTGYSTRYTTSSNEKETKRDWIYPHLINDISLLYRLKLNTHLVEFRFKVYNLLDENYRNVLQRPMPGRNYCLIVKYNFHK